MIMTIYLNWWPYKTYRLVILFNCFREDVTRIVNVEERASQVHSTFKDFTLRSHTLFTHKELSVEM